MARPRTILIASVAIACASLYLMWSLFSPAQLAEQGIQAVASKRPPQTALSPHNNVVKDSAKAQASSVVEKLPQPPGAESTAILHGSVGNVAGAALVGIEVIAESHGFDGENINAIRAISDQRGEFRLTNLVPGRRYSLSIKAQKSYAGYSLDSFSVNGAKRLQDIILEQIQLVDVDGMIVDTDHAPVADFELNLRHASAEFPDRIIRSDASGYFRLEGFPAGEVRFATSASDYIRIRGLELRPDEYRTLTLVIDRGAYHLSGWVHDDNGAPLDEAKVTLQSAFETGGYHSYSYRSTTTDAGGGFEFANLGGHRVTLGVYARGYSTHVQRHQFQSYSDRLEIGLSR